MTPEPRDIHEIGFIGLGAMGSAQAGNLLRRSGLPVRVFDASPEAVQQLVDQGARPAGSAAEVAAQVDVVFLSLPGGPQVESVLLDDEGVFAAARPGTVVVDLSTIAVSTARSVGAEAENAGVAFVDAPVARTRQAAIEGTLSMTVGADEAAYARVEPLLQHLASDITHCGPNGAGSLIKLVNNMVVFETVVALAEALTVIRRSGLVDEQLGFEALAQGSAASFVLESHGRRALLPDVHEEGQFPTEYMRKDLSYILQLAAEIDTSLPSARLAYDLLGEAVERGLGASYHTAVVRVIEQEQRL